MPLNLTFGALDRVDYERIAQTCKSYYAKFRVKKSDDDASRQEKYALQTLAANTLVKDIDLLPSALETLPVHLVYLLLRQAIKIRCSNAVHVLVAQWPYKILDMRQVMPEERDTLLATTMGVDTQIVVGLMTRELEPETSKMNCLDLRTFAINEVFSHVLAGVLPMMSLKRNHREPNRLAKTVLDYLSGEGSRDLSSLTEGMETIIKKQLDHCSAGYVYVPENERLVIKLDRLDFCRQNAMFLDFLLMGALRQVTPCYVEACNLYISTNIQDNERLIDSGTPCLALLGQDPEILQGLSLNNMEGFLFQYILSGVARFSALRALDIGNCSISVVGRTRMRSALRMRIVNLFSNFSQLCRLELAKSKLKGELGKLLGSLEYPLEYLSLDYCTLDRDDMLYLSSCKHTASLRELHLKHVIGVEGGGLQSADIMDCLDKMTATLVVLDLQNNDMHDGEECLPRLLALLPNFSRLHILDTLYNYLQEDMLIKLVDACTSCPNLCYLALNLIPIFGDEEEVARKREHFEGRCNKVLQKYNRTDITLYVMAIGVAAIIQ